MLAAQPQVPAPGAALAGAAAAAAASAGAAGPTVHPRPRRTSQGPPDPATLWVTASHEATAGRPPHRLRQRAGSAVPGGRGGPMWGGRRLGAACLRVQKKTDVVMAFTQGQAHWCCGLRGAGSCARGRQHTRSRAGSGAPAGGSIHRTLAPPICARPAATPVARAHLCAQKHTDTAAHIKGKPKPKQAPHGHAQFTYRNALMYTCSTIHTHLHPVPALRLLLQVWA